MKLIEEVNSQNKKDTPYADNYRRRYDSFMKKRLEEKRELESPNIKIIEDIKQDPIVEKIIEEVEEESLKVENKDEVYSTLKSILITLAILIPVAIILILFYAFYIKRFGGF